MKGDQDRVENEAYGAFCRRIVRALAKRVGNGDPEDLIILRAVSGELEQAYGSAIHGLKQQGWSYARIGAQLDMTRQSAWERHRRWLVST